MRFPKKLPVLSVATPNRPPASVVELGPMIPAQFSHPGLSLMQIFSIVWAYRKQTLMILASITLVVGITLKLLPKMYSATATLMVNYEANDPLAAGEIPVGVLMGYMSTRIQLMESGEVLLPVIQKLNLTSDPEYTLHYRGDPADLPDAVQEELAKNLEILQGAFGSQLIYVTASARDPKKAALIANTLSEVYAKQELSRQTGPASERAERYAQQLAELKAKVNLAQDNVTQFRQKTGITDLTAQNTVESALLATLEGHLQDAQNARRAAEVKALGNQAVSNSYINSITVQQLKAQLTSQETQLAQLQGTLGPQHPKVIELNAQIEVTRRSLEAETRTYSSSASAEVNAARQLEQKLQAAVDQQRNKTMVAHKLQDDGTKYVLELESAQSVYKKALDGYDQIMFATSGHNTDVNFVSRAVPPREASKPKKVKLLLLGMLGGLVLGLAAPMWYELFVKRRVRCRDDFERDFGVPVLMEFDPIQFAAVAV